MKPFRDLVIRKTGIFSKIQRILPRFQCDSRFFAYITPNTFVFFSQISESILFCSAIFSVSTILSSPISSVLAISSAPICTVFTIFIEITASLLKILFFYSDNQPAHTEHRLLELSPMNSLASMPPLPIMSTASGDLDPEPIFAYPPMGGQHMRPIMPEPVRPHKPIATSAFAPPRSHYEAEGESFPLHFAIIFFQSLYWLQRHSVTYVFLCKNT